MPSPSVAIDSRGLFSGNSSFHTETNQADASYNLSIEELKPISCGERTFSGVAVQAVLLSPSGPLVLQTQFERTTVSQFGAGQPPVSMDPFELPNLLEAYLTHEAHPFEGDASGLLELILWALRLLHSPQPTLFVEWHLQSPHHNPHHTPQAGNFGMSATPFSHSIFFRLLTVYQKFANCQSGAPVGHTSYTDASSVAGAVENTLREFVPCSSTQFFDGKERPLVFVKDMEVTGETERYIGTDTVISSIRTHLN
ncbi:hypothetical protein AGDE_12868 [Angomonas deanei]|uniref:Uncharacterized protein n=1 Tax=Angomonas deanei TaxID=59799 RepID=A0A7G2C1E4_9TRYP|nr:hypothetical protein AGDE_12868 [Angomonas deanei]CAD2213345.1 hypothetical protein, conserved [Angomonas deanei]|eukprot:EPY23365.1 hypothetical protein AGDE_12868 [Angomonas deanei]